MTGILIGGALLATVLAGRHPVSVLIALLAVEALVTAPRPSRSSTGLPDHHPSDGQ